MAARNTLSRLEHLKTKAMTHKATPEEEIEMNLLHKLYMVELAEAPPKEPEYPKEVKHKIRRTT